MIPRILLILGLATLAFTPLPSRASTRAVHELEVLGHTAGVKHLAKIAGITAEGSESIDGLKCQVHSIVDLHNGEWRKTVHCPVFDTAQGIDSRGAWKQDRSGQVHSLDSPEAEKLTITDRWLNRHGPYYPKRLPAKLQSLPPGTVHNITYQRIEATPGKGRMVTLWIGGPHNLIARTVMQRSFQIKTTDYSDYRNVGGVILPFRIVSNIDAHSQPDIETISRYQLLQSIPYDSLKRPANRLTDTQIPTEGVRIPFETSVSGKLLVEARINGKGPFPFVLDTGGHAILTPATAHKLNLTLSGHGAGHGAGAGSTPFRYTRVKSISLGKAQIDDQSMLVMPFSPILTDRGDKPPIAGLLGLEVFDRFAVTIDSAHKMITLQPFQSCKPPANAAALPIRFTDDMPLVPATLDGKAGIFGLDTGNSGPLMIFPTWATHNGLARYYQAGLPEPDGGVGGMFMAHVAYIHSLKLGGLALPGKNLGLLTPHGVGSTSNPSEAGNLGMTVWRAFRFTLDYRNERLYLTPRPHYTPELLSATGGFRAVKLKPAAFTVIQVSPNGPAAKAGLKKGNQIVAVNRVKAKDLASLYLMAHIAKSKPGTRLKLALSDGHTVTVVLGSNAAMQKALHPKVAKRK